MIIAFSGKLGSGKSFAAKAVKDILFTYSPEIVSFATGIKQMAKEQFGWDGVKDEKGRRLLQQLGAAGRAYDPDLWIKKLDVLRNPLRLTLIDDLRYVNEFQYVKASHEDSLCIRLMTDRTIDLSDDKNLHESETALDEHEQLHMFDAAIFNTYDDKFKAVLKEIMHIKGVL